MVLLHKKVCLFVYKFFILYDCSTIIYIKYIIIGSSWKDKISLEVLELQEKGEIQMLYDKWWKSPGLTCIRDEMKNKDGKASPLGLENIGGVFVVLLLGLVIALMTAFAEFLAGKKQPLRLETNESIDVAYSDANSSQMGIY